MKNYNYDDIEEDLNYGGIEEDLSLGAILGFALICMILIILFVFLSF